MLFSRWKSWVTISQQKWHFAISSVTLVGQGYHNIFHAICNRHVTPGLIHTPTLPTTGGCHMVILKLLHFNICHDQSEWILTEMAALLTSETSFFCFSIVSFSCFNLIGWIISSCIDSSGDWFRASEQNGEEKEWKWFWFAGSSITSNWSTTSGYPFKNFLQFYYYFLIYLQYWKLFSMSFCFPPLFPLTR